LCCATACFLFRDRAQIKYSVAYRHLSGVIAFFFYRLNPSRDA
jgi:hypothetical protein